MSERLPGYYWIGHTDGEKRQVALPESWSPAYWDGKCWWLIGIGVGMEPDSYYMSNVKIGSSIEVPNI